MTVLEAVDVAKSYVGGDGSTINVLDGVNLAVARGEMVAIVGASGAGTSTLLHLLGALDAPSRGSVRLDGADVGGLDDDALAALRNRKVGFVFQFHHLLREFSALENVMMPLRIAGVSEADAQGRAAAQLERVGLGNRGHHFPMQLSGGEQQRVAIARAFANSPRILFADEPTGNLDANTGKLVFDLLESLNRESGSTIVLVTHDAVLAERAARTIRLSDGNVVSDTEAAA